jgi:hypothetical protein
MTSAATFPCTLADIGGDARLVHVTAEARGLRFYLGSGQTFPEAEAIVAPYLKADFVARGVSFFLVNRNSHHSINGGPAEFAALFANH